METPQHRSDFEPQTTSVARVADRVRQCGVDVVSLLDQLCDGPRRCGLRLSLHLSFSIPVLLVARGLNEAGVRGGHIAKALVVTQLREAVNNDEASRVRDPTEPLGGKPPAGSEPSDTGSAPVMHSPSS